MPKISVIVPVYKVEQYIGRCIESILAQTFRDFELILVDDGSPDNSGTICDEYADKDNRIKVIHKKNGGVSSARNAGIEVATGEWLCFVDSDDVIDETYLEDFELDKVHSEIYFQGFKKVYGQRDEELHDFSTCRSASFIEILAFSEDESIINSPCFKLYNRNIIIKNCIRFDCNTSYGEDHIFSLDYVMHINSAHYSFASGYNYMVNGTESLCNRIIPLQEITYYARESRKRQLALYTKYGNQTYLKSINYRLSRTITNAVRGLYKQNVLYKDYMFIYRQCCPLIKDGVFYGLDIRQRLFMFIFGYFNPKFTFTVLKKIL